MDFQENICLGAMTTLQVGGPARYFAESKSAEDARIAVEFARSRDLPIFVLGGGSNVVIADSGWPGLVLKIGIRSLEKSTEGDSTIFEVGAGMDWDKFVAMTVAENCAGLECLSGIPGSVGATPVQNVGAYGQEVADTIDSVLVLDRKDMQVRELCKEACGFAYRQSIFNTDARDRFIILRVSYRLTPEGQPQIKYADLQKYFSGWTSTPTLSETREAVRQIRASKGMLIRPGDDDCRSVGSFFKNPVLTETQLQDIQHRAAVRNLNVPSYPALAAHHKISAAWLVEHSGFARGYTEGSVGISRKHALAIVNRGRARAADIVAFQEQIRERVDQVWGISLEPEPVFVGF
jgi:UDP-N-acetylmuramate dehydrogenase